MMKILEMIKAFFKIKAQGQIVEKDQTAVYEQTEEKKSKISILSVWDVLKFTDHTQAAHLVSVIRFDEWVTMDEIRRRIYELFQIDYQNERSLYPYLKTLVDIGLIETTNIGGKRKWRKKDLLIKTEEKENEKEEIEEKEAITQQA